MEDDEAEIHHQKTQKAIISALAWVSRGHARATLQEYNPTEEEIKENKQVAKKLLKGKDPTMVDIGEAKEQIEANMKKQDNDMEESSDDGTNAPIFTSELGKLKEKYKGAATG